MPSKLDFGRGPPPPSAATAAVAAAVDDNDEDAMGDDNQSFSMESIYDSLVVDEDEEAAPTPNQEYPPWFENFPGYSAQQLADLIWRGQLPPQVEQLLRARQQEFMASLGGAGAQPPQPSAHLQHSRGGEDDSSGRSDLFDRHHHTNLVYWKRNFQHMSAEEVDALVSQQRLALKYSSYPEDYYYQQTTARRYADGPPPRSAPPLTGIHRPICLEPLEPPARSVPAELSVGVLGKMVFSSLKRPRPLLQLDGTPPPRVAPEPERMGSSAAVCAVESGSWTRRDLLAVCEDGLLLALLLADLGAVVPQLPSHEQPMYLARQQALVAALVNLLNPCMASSVLAALLGLSKGRQLLARCLQTLPGPQRLALLCVLLGSAQELPLEDARLPQAILQVCGSSLTANEALQALQALAQAFSAAALFATFVGSKLGAALLAALLASVRRGPPPATAHWQPVFAGLLAALLPSLPLLCAPGADHPIWTALLHLLVLAGPSREGQVLRSALAPPLSEAYQRFGSSADLSVPLTQLLEKAGVLGAQ